MASLEILEYATAAAFLEALRPSNDKWWDAARNRPSHYFRGHEDSGWRLLASGHRPLGPANRLTSLYSRLEAHLAKPEVRKPPFSGNALRLLIWKNALCEACYQFSEICRQVGLRANYFMWESPFLTGMMKGPIVEPEIWPLAQHHGVPTPLLDWTENSLVAAFFAVRNDFVSAAPCVWALKVSEPLPRVQMDIANDPVALKVSFHSSIENQYLTSQKGLFTQVSAQEAYFWRFGEWLDLETLHELMPNTILTKMVLPRSEAPHLRQLLYREGISAAHLMPTYDNAARLAEDLYSEGGL